MATFNSDFPDFDDLPDDVEVELCAGCAICDREVTGFMLGLEQDLRTLSLDLWVAGWTPTELIDEVRRTTGRTETSDLLAHLLIVDDSHRSDQAKTEAWRSEMEILRATTGIDDVALGWLVRWVQGQPSSQAATNVLGPMVRTLSELVDPAVAR